MANAWIFHGSTLTKDMEGGGITHLYDGQYLVATEETFGQNYTIFTARTRNSGTSWGTVRWVLDQSTNASTVQLPLGNGRYLRRMSSANSLRYGSGNYHSKSGGNLYTIRSTTQMATIDGYTRHTLNPGDRVIIQPGGSFFDVTRKRIRAWGFRRKGSSTDNETSGLYVNDNPLGDPSYYKVNTI